MQVIDADIVEEMPIWDVLQKKVVILNTLKVNEVY